VLPGLWRFESTHPEWTEAANGWTPEVAWYAIATGDGVLLVDPLVEAWEELDALVTTHGGCCGVLRTLYFHQRTVAEAALRYSTQVLAHPPTLNAPPRAFDRGVGSGDRLAGGITAFTVARADELALWVPTQRALIFGDVLLRDADGRLRVCPAAWLDPGESLDQVRAALSPLADLHAEHVLVGHGPLVLDDGRDALAHALTD
jgi:glyoxylase-like metal-dependent hydrolase (beta-lactamase superfamily II)